MGRYNDFSGFKALVIKRELNVDSLSDCYEDGFDSYVDSNEYLSTGAYFCDGSSVEPVPGGTCIRNNPPTWDIFEQYACETSVMEDVVTRSDYTNNYKVPTKLWGNDSLNSSTGQVNYAFATDSMNAVLGDMGFIVESNDTKLLLYDVWLTPYKPYTFATQYIDGTLYFKWYGEGGLKIPHVDDSVLETNNTMSVVESETLTTFHFISPVVGVLSGTDYKCNEIGIVPSTMDGKISLSITFRYRREDNIMGLGDYPTYFCSNTYRDDTFVDGGSTTNDINIDGIFKHYYNQTSETGNDVPNSNKQAKVLIQVMEFDISTYDTKTNNVSYNNLYTVADKLYEVRGTDLMKWTEIDTDEFFHTSYTNSSSNKFPTKEDIKYDANIEYTIEDLKYNSYMENGAIKENFRGKIGWTHFNVDSSCYESGLIKSTGSGSEGSPYKYENSIKPYEITADDKIYYFNVWSDTNIVSSLAFGFIRGETLNNLTTTQFYRLFGGRISKQNIDTNKFYFMFLTYNCGWSMDSKLDMNYYIMSRHEQSYGGLGWDDFSFNIGGSYLEHNSNKIKISLAYGLSRSYLSNSYWYPEYPLAPSFTIGYPMDDTGANLYELIITVQRFADGSVIGGANTPIINPDYANKNNSENKTSEDEKDDPYKKSHYDNNVDPIDIVEPKTTNVCNTGLLTTYKIDAQNIKNLANDLFNDNIIEELIRGFTKPLSAVIKLSETRIKAKYTSTQTSIKLGNQTMLTARGNKLLKDVVEYDLGRVNIYNYYNNYLAYQSKIQIYLPFVGWKMLDNDWCINKSFHLFANCNFITGNILYYIYGDDVFDNTSETPKHGQNKGYCNKYLINVYSGNMFSELPLGSTSNDRLLSSIASISLGVATHSANMGIANAIGRGVNTYMPSYQYTSELGQNNASMERVFEPMIFVQDENTPISTDDETKTGDMTKVTGYESCYKNTISNMRGFIQLDNPNIRVTGITKEESDEINQLLTNGVWK